MTALYCKATADPLDLWSEIYVAALYRERTGDIELVFFYRFQGLRLISGRSGSGFSQYNKPGNKWLCVGIFDRLDDKILVEYIGRNIRSAEATQK